MGKLILAIGHKITVVRRHPNTSPSMRSKPCTPATRHPGQAAASRGTEKTQPTYLIPILSLTVVQTSEGAPTQKLSTCLVTECLLKNAPLLTAMSW